jgi:hypothetical protein
MHTPGPWPYREWFEDAGFEVMRSLANFRGLPLSDDEVAANAGLMAAAPDLLEALKAMFNGTCFCDFPKGGLTHHGRHCELAQAAIAKAEGR